jgi:hypothetical protein
MSFLVEASNKSLTTYLLTALSLGISFPDYMHATRPVLPLPFLFLPLFLLFFGIIRIYLFDYFKKIYNNQIDISLLCQRREEITEETRKVEEELDVSHACNLENLFPRIKPSKDTLSEICLMLPLKTTLTIIKL